MFLFWGFVVESRITRECGQEKGRTSTTDKETRVRLFQKPPFDHGPLSLGLGLQGPMPLLKPTELNPSDTKYTNTGSELLNLVMSNGLLKVLTQ